jgi:hypothetical protein
MRPRFRGTIAAGILALLAALAADAAEAQVFTPTYTSPRLLNEIGIHLSDGPGDLAVEGIWRGGPLGLRVGFVDTKERHLSIGGELRSLLEIPDVPLGLAFTAGAQGLIGDNGGVGVQAGLTAGHTFRGATLAFTPYMHPRIGMFRQIGRSGPVPLGGIGRSGPADDWHVELKADVGADFEFHPNIVARLGINVGGVGAGWGVGLAWRR